MRSSAASRRRPVCIFCGSDSKPTKEDVWPTWLKKYVPRDLKNYAVGETRVFPTHTDETRKEVDGDPRSRRVRRVCAACNNGWMSRLQESAKPLLLPLVTGGKLVLGQGDQKLVAAWCAMSTMTSDFYYPDRQAIPQVDREWLKNHRSPPPDTWRIWIARYRREKWVSHWIKNSIPVAGEKHISEIAADDTPRPNTQTTSLVLGELYVHAYSSIFPKLVSRIGISPPLSEMICQIWPIREHFVAWPIEPITDRQADNLAGAIAQVISDIAVG
jgi:hypothetical protein